MPGSIRRGLSGVVAVVHGAAAAVLPRGCRLVACGCSSKHGRTVGSGYEGEDGRSPTESVVK